MYILYSWKRVCLFSFFLLFSPLQQGERGMVSFLKYYAATQLTRKQDHRNLPILSELDGKDVQISREEDTTSLKSTSELDKKDVQISREEDTTSLKSTSELDNKDVQISREEDTTSLKSTSELDGKDVQISREEDTSLKSTSELDEKDIQQPIEQTEKKTTLVKVTMPSVSEQANQAIDRVGGENEQAMYFVSEQNDTK